MPAGARRGDRVATCDASVGVIAATVPSGVARCRARLAGRPASDLGLAVVLRPQAACAASHAGGSSRHPTAP